VLDGGHEGFRVRYRASVPNLSTVVDLAPALEVEHLLDVFGALSLPLNQLVPAVAVWAA
jgi:hypothetical protein